MRAYAIFSCNKQYAMITIQHAAASSISSSSILLRKKASIRSKTYTYRITYRSTIYYCLAPCARPWEIVRSAYQCQVPEGHLEAPRDRERIGPCASSLTPSPESRRQRVSPQSCGLDQRVISAY